MIDDFLRLVFANQWLVITLISLLLLAFSEVGFRMGLRIFRVKDEPRKSQISGVQSAVLALLGLLLAFTFSMSAGRFEKRRELAVAEANAIGTTFLRASFLPAENQAAVENMLRRYVDVRIDCDNAATNEARASMGAEMGRIQRELWSQAVAAGKQFPTPITTSFVNSLNETIDLDAARINALRARVPGPVWLLLLIVAFAGCYACGYGTGATGARSTIANILLPLLIAVVITLIADLDRPHHGLIGTSQESLIDLKASISKTTQ